MLTVPRDFSSYLFEKLTDIRTWGISQSKSGFHASVASETKVSNVCSPNNQGTENAIVYNFFVRS